MGTEHDERINELGIKRCGLRKVAGRGAEDNGGHGTPTASRRALNIFVCNRGRPFYKPSLNFASKDLEEVTGKESQQAMHNSITFECSRCLSENNVDNKCHNSRKRHFYCASVSAEE